MSDSIIRIIAPGLSAVLSLLISELNLHVSCVVENLCNGLSVDFRTSFILIYLHRIEKIKSIIAAFLWPFIFSIYFNINLYIESIIMKVNFKIEFLDQCERLVLSVCFSSQSVVHPKRAVIIPIERSNVGFGRRVSSFKNNFILSIIVIEYFRIKMFPRFLQLRWCERQLFALFY